MEGLRLGEAGMKGERGGGGLYDKKDVGISRVKQEGVKREEKRRGIKRVG